MALEVTPDNYVIDVPGNGQIKNSILHDIKQLIGQEWDDPTYDTDTMIHINSVFFNLNQIGVGPEGGYIITGPENLWTEFIGDIKNLHAVKTYVYIRVRLILDPPGTGPLVEALERQADKLEWTLLVEVDPPLNPPIPVAPSAPEIWSIP